MNISFYSTQLLWQKLSFGLLMFGFFFGFLQIRRDAGLISKSMLTSANKLAYKNLGERKLEISRTQN